MRIGQNNRRFVKDCFGIRWIVKLFHRVFADNMAANRKSSLQNVWRGSDIKFIFKLTRGMKPAFKHTERFSTLCEPSGVARHRKERATNQSCYKPQEWKCDFVRFCNDF